MLPRHPTISLFTIHGPSHPVRFYAYLIAYILGLPCVWIEEAKPGVTKATWVWAWGKGDRAEYLAGSLDSAWLTVSEAIGPSGCGVQQYC